MITTLIALSLLYNAKADLTARYPDRAVQIAQVGLPSIGYRDHVWFDRRMFAIVWGMCDEFARPQVQVARGKSIAVTIARLYHELRHWVVAASGIVRSEDKRIDIRVCVARMRN